jgi:hypothetical protein
MQDSLNAGGDLRWVQPKRRKRDSELHAGETVVATLRWTAHTRAFGQWGAAQYEFSREGWLRQRVLIRVAATDAGPAGEPLATYTQRGATLAFPDGRTLLWKKPRRLTRERLWVDSAGTELVRFRPEKGSTLVLIGAAEATPPPELPLVILLGQYMLVLAAQDAEEASVAASVTAVVASS